jgi:hypothetical protein
MAVLRDYRTSGGVNRPPGTGKWPLKAGEADINYLPPTSGFDPPDLGELLDLFQEIDLDRPESESPILVNWEYLERKLGLSREAVDALWHLAAQRGLMKSLTIDYDHERWLRHSRDKGCLVVMSCVEATDLDREVGEIAECYCNVVDKLVKVPPPHGLLNKEHSLSHVYVVPNGHLDRAGSGIGWKSALEVLKALPPALEQRGYDAMLNSYGYEKLIKLAINAHKLGYVLRVV